MDSLLHELIHLLTEIEKEDTKQEESIAKKHKLWNEVGKIMTDMTKESK